LSDIEMESEHLKELVHSRNVFTEEHEFSTERFKSMRNDIVEIDIAFGNLGNLDFLSVLSNRKHSIRYETALWAGQARNQ
jgi:hypothetical protein